MGEGFSASWKSIWEILTKIDHECGEKLLELGTPNEDSIPLITATLGNIQCNEETYIVLGNFQDIQMLAFVQTGSFERGDMKLC